MELIPLKTNTKAGFPAWGRKKIIENAPFGWMPDNACGLNDERTGAGTWDSPKGTQLFCLLASEVLANELGYDVISETEFEMFYDNYFVLPGVVHDVNVLQKLKAEHDLRVIAKRDTLSILKRINNAIDDIDRLTARKWADFKLENEIIIL
jgi:hypothetical protein